VSAVDDEEVGDVSMVAVLVRTVLTLVGFVNGFNADMRKIGCAGVLQKKFDSGSRKVTGLTGATSEGSSASPPISSTSLTPLNSACPGSMFESVRRFALWSYWLIVSIRDLDWILDSMMLVVGRLLEEESAADSIGINAEEVTDSDRVLDVGVATRMMEVWV